MVQCRPVKLKGPQSVKGTSRFLENNWTFDILLFHGLFPSLCPQIMFWGVREPKRVQLLTVDRPRAEVEVAGVVTTTKPIANMQKNSNFDKTLDFVDLVSTGPFCLGQIRKFVEGSTSLRKQGKGPTMREGPIWFI